MSGYFALNKEYRVKNVTYFRWDKLIILPYLTHLNAMHVICWNFTITWTHYLNFRHTC
jgi:hypothetical protein